MLRASIAEAEQAAFPPFFLPFAAQAPLAAQRLIARYGERQAAQKPDAEREALLARLAAVDFDWERVAPADRLEITTVLWLGEAPPAERTAFLKAFLAWIEHPRRRYQASRLAFAWATAFDPALPSMRLVGEWLDTRRQRLPDPWASLAAEFPLFSLEAAPAALADCFVAGKETAAQFFAHLGLPAAVAEGGLGAEILAATSERVARRSAKEPGLALRLCDLALHAVLFRTDAKTKREIARRQRLRRAVAEALLLPWERQAPPQAVRADVLAFLLRHYGDPRIAPQAWPSVRAPANAIMRRWATEETVATYFRLATRSNSADRDRLTQRAQFWFARLGEIDDAWLLTAAREAPGAGSTPLGHGRLGGGRADQVALLLRVGDITVLEATHLAHESIWCAGSPFAPPLYGCDNIYWSAGLTRGVDFSSAFGDKGSCSWQERLALFLERQRSS